MIDRRHLIKSATFLVPALISRKSYGFSDLFCYDQDCGVASGDPSEDGFVVWTRIPVKGRAPKGQMTGVFLEVATDSGFDASTIVYRAELLTSLEKDFTVKTRVRGLQSRTFYYYRFSNGGEFTSVVGRSKTTPSALDECSELKVGFVSCQSMSDGLYSVFNSLALEDLDVVLHLGDHIYEKEPGRPGGVDPLFGAEAETVEDYRAKYRYYLSDPAYREVRRLFPWVDIWDDHEVADDYAGSVDRKKNKLKFGGAYQAFSEYMPFETQLEYGQEGVPELAIHRKISFGKKLEILATDSRQHRSPKPGYRRGERNRSDRTMLGTDQKTWIKNQLVESEAQWKIIMTSVMMTPLRIGLKSQSQDFFAEKIFGESRSEEQGIYINLDQWDGFTSERSELLEFITQESIPNVVFIAGDVHASFDSLLYGNPDQVQGPPAAVEIVTSSISSTTIGRLLGKPLAGSAEWILRQSNPHIVSSDISKSGYVVLSISDEGTQVRRMLVDNVWVPGVKAVPQTNRWIPSGKSILV